MEPTRALQKVELQRGRAVKHGSAATARKRDLAAPDAMRRRAKITEVEAASTLRVCHDHGRAKRIEQPVGVDVLVVVHKRQPLQRWSRRHHLGCVRKGRQEAVLGAECRLDVCAAKVAIRAIGERRPATESCIAALQWAWRLWQRRLGKPRVASGRGVVERRRCSGCVCIVVVIEATHPRRCACMLWQCTSCTGNDGQQQFGLHGVRQCVVDSSEQERSLHWNMWLLKK